MISRWLESLKSHIPIWIPALLLTVILFLQLGNRGLNEPDEGRYGEMSREMLVTGDWMVPRLNGVPHYAKPPWIYWCTATSLKFFGVNEWSARLPSALAALVTGMTVFILGRRMAGPMGGLLSLLVLTCSMLYFATARLLTPDMMLTALVTLALACFWQWWSGGLHQKGWLLGFYLATGVAFFNKGPVSLAITFLTILTFLFFSGKIRVLARMYLPIGLLLIACIALPWFLMMCRLNPDLYEFFLKGEIQDRVMSGRGRLKTWWYFLLVFPAACWPWTFQFFSALKDHLSQISQSTHWKTPSTFLLSWLVPSFIMFNLVSSKLPTYILPLMPPMSLLVGLWLARQMEQTQESPRQSWTAWLDWLLLPVIALAPIFLTHRVSPDLDRHWIILFAIGLGASILSLLVIYLLRLPATILPMARWLTALLVLHLVLGSFGNLETQLGHNSSWRSLTRVLDGKDLVGVPISLDLHPSDKKPSFQRPGPRIAMYEFYDRSASFYLMGRRAEVVPIFAGNSLWEMARDLNMEKKPTRDDLIVLLREPETIYVLTRPRHLEELRSLTGMELPVVRSASQGKYEVVLFSNQKVR